MENIKIQDEDKQSFRVGLAITGEIDDAVYKLRGDTLVVQSGFEFRSFTFARVLLSPRPETWYAALLSRIVEADSRTPTQACVFSYGGAAERNTIMGGEAIEGVAHCVVRQLFDRLAAKPRKSIVVRCYELCREKVVDLFDKKKKIIAREAKGALSLQNLTEIEIGNIVEVS